MRVNFPLRAGAKTSAQVFCGLVGRTAGTVFDLNVATMSGGQVCPLIFNSTVNLTPGAYKARLVNNTDVNQPVLLVPTSRGGNLRWNLAVSVEP